MPKQNKKSPSQKNREDKLRKRLERHKLGTEESKDIPRPASQQLFTVANPNSQSQQPTTSKIDSQKILGTEESKDIPRPASQQLFTVANPNSQSQQPTTSKIDSQKKKRKSQDTNLFATTSTTDIPTEPARTKELNWFCEYLNDQDMRNIHKKSLYSPKHSKNLNASLPGLTQQELNNLSTRKKRQCPQNRRTENEKRNLTRKERRNIPEVKDQENARRNETRSHRRSMNEVKEQESVRRNITRQKRCCVPEVKEQESARSNITRKKRRSIPEVKEQESARSNITRKKRRSIPEVKEQESARSNITRKKRRSIPEVKEQESARRNITRQKRHSIPEVKEQESARSNITRQKRRCIPEVRDHGNAKRQKTRQDRRSIPEVKEQESARRNITRQKRHSIPEVKEQESSRSNITRQKRRSIPEVKEQESARSNITRQKRRCIPEVRDQESSRSNITRQKRRCIPEVRDHGNAKRQKTRQDRRSIPEVKEQESARRNITRQKRRSIPEVKEQESSRSNITRQKRRCIPEVRDHGNAKRQKTRQDRRSIPDVKEQESVRRNITRQKRRSIPKVRDKEKTSRQKWRHTYNRNKKETHLNRHSRIKKKSDIEIQIQIFRDLLKRSDDFICSCCMQTFYQHSVYACSKEHYMQKGIPQEILDQTLTGTKSVSESEWVCKTCHKYIMEKKMPPTAYNNGFKYDTLPDYLHHLSPTQTEERTVALCIPFMQLKELGVGKQFGIYGNTVNVPMDPSDVISVLPRRFEDTATIHLLFKRKLEYKSSILHETVRPKVIYELVKYFIGNSPLYQEEAIQLDTSWTSENTNIINFASETDIEVIESHEKLVQMQSAKNQRAQDNTLPHSKQNQEKNKLISDENDDNWVEQSDEEVSGSGNKDTLLQNLDFTDDGRHALQIAPGEKNHPLSLFLDKYAEEKSFPVLFAGQKRIENHQRTIPVTFSTICKAELRSADTRFSTSVPNIFFKLKKLQTLQVKDITTTALRKTNNNSYTAGQLKSSENINSLLQNDQGFTFLKTLRSSPPYYQNKQKELFAILRQLGLPTFFATFSAAETQWLDLLCILAKKEYKRDISVEETIAMNWMQRCELIQKHPTTCARHFHYRTQIFLNNILKCKNSPLGELQDYYIRVEFQQRGSPHLHCLFWIKNSPIYGSSQMSDILEFIDAHITSSSNVSEEDQQFVKLQKHRHSKSCKKKGKRVCRFGFPIPPMAETLILEPFPADHSKTEILKHKDNYKKISIVLETLTGDEDMTFQTFLTKCELNNQQYIDAIRSSLSKKKVFLKRAVNDVRINSYNLQVLRIWQANTDLQFVIDPYAVCIYIASYIMKSQRGMSMLLQNAVDEVKRGNFSVREKMRVISNKFLNHCEVSAQEAIYLLLQLPLTQSSRDVIFINTSTPEKRIGILKPASVLKTLPDESTEVICAGLLDRYSERPPSMENIILSQFASSFEKQVDKKKGISDTVDQIDGVDNNVEEIVAGMKIHLPDGSCLVRRRVPKVIRSVRYSLKKDPELYYREQLMLFYPWREENALKGQSTTYEDEFKIHEAHIISFKAMFDAFTSDESIEEIFEDANQQIVSDEIDDIAPNARQTEDDSEQLRQDMESILQPADSSCTHYDIGQDIGCSNSAKKVAEIVIANKLSDNEYLELVRSLNQEQKCFFYYILNTTKTNDEPYYVFLSGGAGVGKSHVLKAIYQALLRYFDTAGENPDEIKVVIGAPTGKAAYNIKGAVFVLVSLLVVVIAATGLVQIHTRILDKILPVNHLSNPDDESSDENDEDSAYSTVRQFRVSIIQMFEFVVKCNELLAHFYGILKWDNILPSLRFHIEFCTLLLSFVVLPTRWIYIALVNWVFLDNDIVIQLVIDNSQLFIGCLTGQALQSPVSKTVNSKEEIKSEEEVKDKQSTAKDSEDISDLDYDAETIEVTMDEDGKSPSTNKPGMVARLMELKKRRQHIANESCFACKVSFASILKRRFYCRHCGNNFCSKCCNQRVPKSVFGATAPSAQTETVLVCNTCHKNLTKAPDKDKKS